MLVLTRKHQEKIRIGDNITITILKTKGKAVRVGIEAPEDIAVVRGELVANETAATACTASVSDGSVVAKRPRRTSPVESSWTTESRPTVEEPARRRTPMEVRLQRVSRKDAQKILPRIVGEVSPLRSMLVERRATV